MSSSIGSRASGSGWLGGTSALGHITLAVLAIGAAALMYKQFPDLRRYMNIRSM
jgi:hypothetical protein